MAEIKKFCQNPLQLPQKTLGCSQNVFKYILHLYLHCELKRGVRTLTLHLHLHLHLHLRLHLHSELKRGVRTLTWFAGEVAHEG